MELSELKNRICKSFDGSTEDLTRVLEMVDDDQSIFPFNEYEHLICNLIELGGMTYVQYMEIRSEYIRANPNLWIFEMSSPRGFGEGFAQTYVNGMCAQISKPSKEIDPTFSNEYDLCLDSIKIEVKASRAVDSESKEPLYIKALSRNTDKQFLMNFQQLKPQYCDIFIWVAVFRDQIVIWVLSSKEVASHQLFSGGQHRGNEGQLHIKHDNIHMFDKFELKNGDLGAAIRLAAMR
ncbi:MAG: hypothetical protein JKY46_02200 [Robiginitomaculum sp.]|nr:hypothetical protein [Robiginitomaculum sp.]